MTTVIPIAAAGTAITPENKCSVCKGSTCCTYMTQQIDTPRSIEDFDLLLWQISHQHTQVYKDDDAWFLLVNNRCTHLLPGGLCGIYDTRPQVCRDHRNDDCEFEGPSSADDFQQFFPDYNSLVAYCRQRFKHWDKRFDTTSRTRLDRRTA